MSKNVVVEKPKMSKSTKLYWGILVLGIVLAVSGLFYNNDSNNIDSFVDNVDLTPDGKVKVDNLGSGIISGAVDYDVTGILQNSDNLNRGNLKVISSLGDVYIRTQRDFSGLVGFSVTLVTEGTLDSFKLVDIIRE